MNPEIKSVTALDHYKLELIFTNDEHGIYDCSLLLDFGVFQELKDETYFRSVKIDDESIAWSNGQCIYFDVLYLDSEKVL